MTFDRASCRFGYRDSLFKGEERGRYAILEVHLRLRRGGAPAIRYPELARALADGATAGPDLQQVRRTVLDLRRRKGMVLDPADPDSRSDGSFFVNPVLTIEEHRLFLGRVTECLGEAVVPASFPADDGRIKVSAAWLVEHAGYSRGHRQGGAGISSKHALALVNLGHGSATEIVALARQIQADVLRRFAIRLRVEPVLVGFSSSPNEVAEED